jgi:hypothetical protein
MVEMPWIFLKPHATKRSSTLQGQMQIHIYVHCSTIQSGGHKCEAKITFNVWLTPQPMCFMGGSNL